MQLLLVNRLLEKVCIKGKSDMSVIIVYVLISFNLDKLIVNLLPL